MKPAATARTLASPGTGAGVSRSVVVPDPSWPKPFQPQDHTVPSLRSASVCRAPAEMSTTPVRLWDTDRYQAVELGPGAQLSGDVPAPHPHGSVRLQRCAVIGARGNGDHPGQPPNRGGSDAIDTVACPQLAESVPTPAPHRAVGLQGESVVQAGGDVHDLGERGHPRRDAGVGGRTRAQLAERVPTPGPYGAVAPDCYAVIAAAGQAAHVSQAACRRRGRRAVGRRSVAELADVVQAPVDGTGRRQRHPPYALVPTVPM